MRRLSGVILALVADRASLTSHHFRRTQAPPRLVVVLVVDQMRNDYIDDYGAGWTQGLRRLLSEGARFRNAAYPYFNTVTCAGHATIGNGHGARVSRDHPQSVVAPGRAEGAVVHRGSRGADDPIRQRAAGRRAQRQTAAGSDPCADARPRARRSRARGDDVDEGAQRNHAGRRTRRRGDLVREQELCDVSRLQSGAASRSCTTSSADRPLSVTLGKTWDRMLPASAYKFTDDAEGEKPTKGWTRVFPHQLGAPGTQAVGRVLHPVDEQPVLRRVPRTDGGGGDRHAAA